MSNDIGWLDDGHARLADFGGKGASLAILRRGGFRVPPGFCVLAPAYQRFVQVNGLEPMITKLLATESLHVPKVAREACSELADALTRATLPDDLEAAIRNAYAVLGGQRPGLVCAVRSSALSEDAAGASSAGLYETYLNLRSYESVREGIIACYRSLWTSRAVQYRAFKKIDSRREAMAVVVMEMVPSEVAGVAFTVNPVTGSRDEIMVNASWGLGEAIVSGRVSPDQFVLSKASGSVVQREIQQKELAILPDPSGASGTVQATIDPAVAGVPALTDDQLRELGDTCQRIEQHYQRPMDIEWAWSGDALYILQARPVTGIA